MDLSKITNGSELAKGITQSIEDPLTLIIVLGFGAILAMLVLLKISFLSMKKADQNAQDTL